MIKQQVCALERMFEFQNDDCSNRAAYYNGERHGAEFRDTLKKGMKIQMMATGKVFEVQEVGVFTPHPRAVEVLCSGEVGFLTASVKEVADTVFGDGEGLRVNREGREVLSTSNPSMSAGVGR